ncbi:MAG TPA: hypothetical protein VGT41_01365 [Candidatus Babeliales bacterium]|nr:hypothetical protein [Candidatus Babeliales bacterium]
MKNIRSSKLRDYWRSTVDSVHCKISRGAEGIAKMIGYARKENWRKREHQHHSQHDHYQHNHRNDKK